MHKFFCTNNKTIDQQRPRVTHRNESAHEAPVQSYDVLFGGVVVTHVGGVGHLELHGHGDQQLLHMVLHHTHLLPVSQHLVYLHTDTWAYTVCSRHTQMHAHMHTHQLYTLLMQNQFFLHIVHKIMSLKVCFNFTQHKPRQRMLE